MFRSATLADLPAFRCGHAQDTQAATGCTVVVAPEGAVCGVDVRGGGPATRETDLLRPENMIEKVHAVVLSGGSAFGLAASTGVMGELAARGIGFPVGDARVPIVVGACLFDLLVGENTHPDAAMGAKACATAFARTPEEALLEGNVGAGCGATVGKLLGPERAMKSGLGTCGFALGDLVVVAIVAVNALGNVRDEDGAWVAGCRDSEGRVMDPLEAFGEMMAATMTMDNGTVAATTDDAVAAASVDSDAMSSDGETAVITSKSSASGPCPNTTIGVVLTNARLTKAQTTKTASTVHDAYARAIKPVHTLNDGDTVFAFASGEVEASPDAVSVLACEGMQAAIVRAVRKAKGACGLPAVCDLEAGRHLR